MIFQKIESVKAQHIQNIKTLKHTSFESFILEDFNHIQWLISSKNQNYLLEYILCSEEDYLIQLRDKYNLPWNILFHCKPTILRSVTTNNRVKIVCYVRYKNIGINQLKCKKILVLENILDHGNIGSIIRNGYMMGINHFLIINPFNCFYQKIIDASRGLIFFSNLFFYHKIQEAVSVLKENDYYFLTSDINGEALENIKDSVAAKDKIAIILGNESDGCSNQWNTGSNIKVKIPMIFNEVCDSLNVAASAAILVNYFR
jgi:TrmH family RNA methyltransferase